MNLFVSVFCSKICIQLVIASAAASALFDHLMWTLAAVPACQLARYLGGSLVAVPFVAGGSLRKELLFLFIPYLI